ncbi:hypothetical protein BJF90_13405 [Pseudonocardia sp. CNS-004]|nr:hypothetical protein BJF90_13405 [Pseudonocardia sp. CNS-004]
MGVAGAPGAGAPETTAIGVSGGRVVALGTDAEVRDLAGPGTTVVDLGGRRVVPGLIDGHIHAVRAGASFDRELHWTGMPSVASALESIRRATATCEPGEWIRAVGGWHPTQFTEGRARPGRSSTRWRPTTPSTCRSSTSTASSTPRHCGRAASTGWPVTRRAVPWSGTPTAARRAG